MTEQEEQLLADKVASGMLILWNPDSNTGRKVISVTERKFKDPEEDEPGLCANFAGGEYVALYNCELCEFIAAERLAEEPYIEES